MSTKQGDLALLDHPVAQELLHSDVPARLAYIWPDGTPRVVPIWFHWTGEELLLSSPVTAPKYKALAEHTQVALTIDSKTFPWKVLLIRGEAQVEPSEGIAPEYQAAARRYLGDEGGTGFVQQMESLGLSWNVIRVQPEWVGLLDFQQRFPSPMAAAMGMEY